MCRSIRLVSIIILNWNNPKDTLECLSSVMKIDYPNFDVIVVDNGSVDDSVEQILKVFPKIVLVQNEKNLGYAEGNNRGICLALEKGADFVFLLNNDTIVDPHILSAFIDAAHSNPKAGVFGAKIYYYHHPTLIWYAGGYVLPSLRCIHEGCEECDLEKKHETVKETNYVCGCALFIRKEAVKKTGLMDGRFFLLWEEVDWCWRLRNQGFKSLFVPNAKVWHKISSSFEGGHRSASWTYYYHRNRLLFLKLHFPLKKRFSFYLKILSRELLTLIFLILKPHNPTRHLDLAALKGSLIGLAL